MMRRRTYHTIQRWRVDVPDVVEEVAVRTQFADDHDGCVASVLRDADAELHI